MTLEFEKLTADLEKMAQTTARRQTRLNEQLAIYREALTQYAADWVRIEDALNMAAAKSDEKFYRSARPLSHSTPLNQAIDPPPPPEQATIIAADGSQIMPDRHAAYLYYLINVGGIIYHHGQGRQPDVFSNPELFYPQDDDRAIDEFNDKSGAVSVERDLAEIGALAEQAWRHRTAVAPLVTLVDQRLLYWPIGSAGVADNAAVTEWGQSMTKVRDAGGYLAGYVDRPGTSYVTTLLQSALALDDPNFEWRTLGQRSATHGITDRDLFRDLLAPGQRSPVFVNVSPANKQFAQQDAENEVCFFYLNPTNREQQIARVDIPKSVTEDEGAVTAVHSLIIDQCRIMGNYPYVIARADEMAVVGRQDASELNFMIDLIMERHGLSEAITSKQGSKELARGGKTRHEGL